MTYTHKLPTLCSATLTLCELDYVTADLYHAEWPNKPRIIWHYKINMLSFPFLLVHKYTLFVCIWSKYLKLYLRKWICHFPSCSYTSIHCLFAFGANIWSCTWGNEAWYRYPWRNIHFITWIIGLALNIQSLARINYIVLCYSCMSM